MKKYIFITFLLVFNLSIRAQEIFSFDFSKDPTGSFIVWDVDKNTPTAEMQKVGFKVGAPWVKIRESNDSPNWFYGSTSAYEPEGQANDWLVTKGIFIQEEGCVLKWKSQAYDPLKRDGLKIFISTKGQNIDDFPNSPEWEIEEESAGISDNKDIIEEEGEWTNHSLILDKYAGKTIYIAFVNQSYNKSIIFIDDIWVGKPQDYVFSNNTERYVSSSEVEVKGVLEVTNNSVIDSYTIHCSYDGNEFSRAYTGLNLKKGDTHEFIFNEKIPLDLHQSIEYRIWITQEEQSSMYTTGTVTRLSHFPKRTVVIEEGTGTWCQYCVSGMWAMDHLYEISKDSKDFIGIAVHNGDPMTVRTYDRALGLNNFPLGVINRQISSSPLGESFQNPWGQGSWVASYLEYRDKMTFFDIDVEGEYNNDSTKITAKAIVTSVLSFEKSDYRVAFVLLENGITGYKQSNAYSGAPYDIGGFEKLPDPCYPVFNDVAQGIWPEFSGIKGSIPSTLTADIPTEYSYEIEIPKGVRNIKNLRLVALLLDATTQEIVNASVYAMTETSNERPSTISNIEAEPMKVLTATRNGHLYIFMDTDKEINACLFDVTGKKISESKAQGKIWFSLPANGYKGLSVLKMESEDTIMTKKIIL